MKILVVDDDMVSRMVLAGLLQRIPGVQIVEAADGLAAWQMLTDGLRPIVCCSDIRMPGLSGLQLVERVRGHALLAPLPIVLITGAADRETVHAAISRGVAGYIIKPFAGAETRATVERVLREALAQQAERPSVTRSRLHQDGASLVRMLEVLLADVRRELAGLEDGTTAELGPDRIAQLRTACLTLGLWRAAQVLAIPCGPEAAVTPAQLLGEVADLLRQQHVLALAESSARPAAVVAAVEPGAA